MIDRLRCKFVLVFTLFLITVTGEQALAGGLVDPDFDWANDFVSAGHDPLVIDNQYWPLVPITAFTYNAESDDECELNITTVLPGQKDWGDVEDDAYDGIRALVVYDEVWVDEDCDGPEDSVLTEETYDWYAQDISENIWYLGEDTVSYDHEECDHWVDDLNHELGCTDGSFQAGVDGAEAGIVMLGSPFKGAFYSQEYYEDEAEDMGKVLNFVPISTDFGEFEDCLMTKEWTPLEPGEVEHKYYCPNVGLVLIGELHGKTKWVELTNIDVITP